VLLSRNPDVPFLRREPPQVTYSCRDAKAPYPLSEIRVVRSRDLRILFGAVFMWVFGADIFLAFEHRLPIGHGHGPGRREDARILDRPESEGCQRLGKAVPTYLRRR
jgi:hypothetical protein